MASKHPTSSHSPTPVPSRPSSRRSNMLLRPHRAQCTTQPVSETSEAYVCERVPTDTPRPSVLGIAYRETSAQENGAVGTAQPGILSPQPGHVAIAIRKSFRSSSSIKTSSLQASRPTYIETPEARTPIRPTLRSRETTRVSIACSSLDATLPKVPPFPPRFFLLPLPPKRRVCKVHTSRVKRVRHHRNTRARNRDRWGSSRISVVVELAASTDCRSRPWTNDRPRAEVANAALKRARTWDSGSPRGRRWGGEGVMALRRGRRAGRMMERMVCSGRRSGIGMVRVRRRRGGRASSASPSGPPMGIPYGLEGFVSPSIALPCSMSLWMPVSVRLPPLPPHPIPASLSRLRPSHSTPVDEFGQTGR
ncbi:hypothetical protein J3F83DRAFT_113525 [Trichoderma novae-zelandiae]